MKNDALDFRKALLPLVVAAVVAPAYAQEGGLNPNVAALGVGIGLSSGDPRERAFFGQYNGLRENDTNLLLDLDYVRRDDATGTWTTLRGRNLGLESRDLGFTLQRQGDWRFSADYNEIVRRDPRTANTSMQGVGTTAPLISLLPAPGTGQDIEFKTKRQGIGLSGDKWISRNLQIEVAFRNEDKTGDRRWGRGFTCPSGAAPAPAVCPTLGTGVNQYALLMVAEPIDWNSKQIDAKLNYRTGKLALSAGYYGSFFTNSNGSLNPQLAGTSFVNFTGPFGAPTPVTLSSQLINILQLPMALPPDNQAHQLYVSGNYAFSPRVNSNFKLGYTHATQTEDFVGMGLGGAPAGRANLGGVLNTTLAQFGITARPTAKLGLSANLRYEDKKDETPIDLYNIEGTSTFTNGHVSNKKVAGKAEATYPISTLTRGALGLDYEQIDRGGFVGTSDVAGLTAIRQKTYETGWHAELRRSIGETLTGAVTYFHSDRIGSDWQRPATTAEGGLGVVGVADQQIWARAGIFPYSMANRTRDRVRAVADWMPGERLSLQFVAEGARDDYDPPSERGLQKSHSQLYSVDAAYTISDAWKLTAYTSLGNQWINMGAGNTGYIAEVNDRSLALGFGVVGKPTGPLEVGAKLSYLSDTNAYRLGPDYGAVITTAGNATTQANNIAQAAVGLPDVEWRETRLNLYAQYALQKNSDIRLDFVHYVAQLNEWTWGSNGVPFIYSDNTTVTLDSNQHVTFLGARYIYKF